jgi:serine protease SohB
MQQNVIKEPVLEFIYEYGMFLAKAVTLVAAVAVIIGLIVGAAAGKTRPKKGQLQFTDLTAQYKTVTTG